MRGGRFRLTPELRSWEVPPPVFVDRERLVRECSGVCATATRLCRVALGPMWFGLALAV